MSRVTPAGAAQLLCCLLLMGALGSAQLQAQTGTNPHQAHAQALWMQQMHMQFQNWLAQQQMLQQQHSSLQSQQQSSPQSSLNGTPGSHGHHGQDPSVRKYLHGLYASPNQSTGSSLSTNQTSNLTSLPQSPSSKQVVSPTIFSRLQPASQAAASNTVSSNRPATVAVNQGPGTGGSSNPPTTAQQCQNQQSLLFRSQDSYTKIVLVGNQQQSQDPSGGNVQNQCLQQQALLNRQTPTTTGQSQSQTVLPTSAQQRFFAPVQPTSSTTTSPVAPTAIPFTTQQPITPVVGMTLPQNTTATPSTSLLTQNLPTSVATAPATSQSGPTTGQSSGLPTGQSSPIMDILAQSIAQMLQYGAYSYVQIVNAQRIREFTTTPQSGSSAPSSTNAPATFGSQN